MPKYTPDDVRRIAERLRTSRDRTRPAHFIIGAGCSITANIPAAAELVKRIHSDYAEHCRDLPADDAHSYGACMALLSINERRDLIKPYLENAKINWGHIALAQLIAEGFIGRVLTLNFDMVLERACSLLGLQPAVYDFGVAPTNDPAMIVSPAIVHLHGQSYGLVLLNTEEETKSHRDKLRPVLTDTLRSAPLVVVGYSGSADGVFQNLEENFEGREALYWVGYDIEPTPHVAALTKRTFARFLGNADFDRFMIDLAQVLGCWPPRLFSNPLGHLQAQLEPIVQYPVGASGSEIDLLIELRSKLKRWGKNFLEAERGFRPVHDAFMKGAFEDAIAAYNALSEFERERLTPEQQDVTAWSFIMSGGLLAEQGKHVTGNEASRLFGEAGEKYRRALAIRPDKYEALVNWGNLLSEQGKRASGGEASRLFCEASEKYRQALAIRPETYEALYNWGYLLFEQAKRASRNDAALLFDEANEKLLACLTLAPAKTYNLACLRSLQNQNEECRDYLLQAEQHGTLPSADHLKRDSDLDNVRNDAWFMELLARVSAQSGGKKKKKRRKMPKRKV